MDSPLLENVSVIIFYPRKMNNSETKTILFDDPTFFMKH